MSTQIAQTILNQLGGNRFAAMTGSKNFVGGDKHLGFKIGTGTANKATHCRIELDATDTYTVTFYKVRGTNVTELSVTACVYADQLRDVFTAATGMYASLGTCGKAA